MAFKLRLAFTGICAFVPNEREDAEVRMCVVLPDGNTPRVSTDNLSLRRHRGFVQFKVRQLSGVPASLHGQDADVVWYLNRHRITLDCTPADAQRNAAQAFQPAAEKSRDKIAGLERMVPGFSTPDPDILQAVPPCTILAHVLLHIGQLVPNMAKERVGRWVFPRTVPDSSFSGDLTSEVTVEIPDLKAVEMIATPFDGGEPTRWNLGAVDGEEEVVITFANLCDDNPLRWNVIDEKIEPDEDFRWYYTLLSNSVQNELITQLGGLSFPIPLPLRAMPNGEGRNCFPITTSSVPYDHDSLLPGREAAPSGVAAPSVPGSKPARSLGSSAVDQGGEYLAQIGLQPSLPTPFRAAFGPLEQPGGLMGELGFRIVDVRGTYTEVELTRLSLVGPGILTDHGSSGLLSLSGLSGRGHLVRTADRLWSLEARLNVQVLYREIEKALPFRQIDAGLYLPDFELFEGVIRADLIYPAGDGEMIATAGTLDLKWLSGGLHWIDHLSVSLRNVVFANLSAGPQRAAMAAAAAAVDPRDCPGMRRLRLQPIAFHNGDKTAHSGTSWDRQLEAARKVWGGGCIQLDAKPLALLNKPELQTSGDVLAIRGSVPENNSEPDLVEILLVDNDLAADGGGASFSCTTALSRVVISNNNAGNPNLLAHELGHVFGGLHHGAQPQDGFWVAEKNTVLDPSGSSNSPNPDRNTAANCRMIRNAALRSTGAGCCISPG